MRTKVDYNVLHVYCSCGMKVYWIVEGEWKESGRGVEGSSYTGAEPSGWLC